MSILLPIIYFSIFVYVIYKMPFFKTSGISFNVLLGIFIVKLLASFSLYWVYTVFYPVRTEADLFKYFDDAKILFSTLDSSFTDYFRIIFGSVENNGDLIKYYEQTNFWYKQIDYGLFNDNRTVIRINALLMLLSFGNIFVHNVFACFISLFSYVLIYKTVSGTNTRTNKLLIISIFLIPSTLFWTSSILKELVVMLGVSFLFYSIHKIAYSGFNCRRGLMFAIAMFILLSIKVYIIIAFLPAAIIYFITAKKDFTPCKSYALAFLICVALLVLNETVLHIAPFLERLAFKRNDFINCYSSANSYLLIGFIDKDILSFVKDTPQALFRAIFLPLPWNIKSAIELLPFLENLLLLTLIVLTIFYRKTVSREQQNVIWFTLFVSFILFWIIGVSTPVVGAIVRYKMPVFPFLYSIFVLLIDWEKLFQKKER